LGLECSEEETRNPNLSDAVAFIILLCGKCARKLDAGKGRAETPHLRSTLRMALNDAASPQCLNHRDLLHGDMPEEGRHSRKCQPSGNNLCGSRECAGCGSLKGKRRAVKLTATALM
jgi:hypothetical protein